ncbi:PREDICTED: RNA-binding motif protein, X-linked 2-like isoform X1 [Branchiostoma belcheri]|uniref:RNA-binding motif protein, X-linked 2-like isoform X1 n=1 Tax=Branchiostoma belcheri TaxID=7741 RepID=A0A6P4YYI9_BRABE|nr:PREDICTED: RNA-binding motif protein, X-linked 2-like isoform X1 [Branchiostoma belcheri]
MSGYMYNVNAIKKLSDQELSSGSGKSWHDQYSDSAWVFVGGLPYELTEGDVLCVFSQYGEIVNINMVRDKKTGKPKGFAFICYENQKSTVLAVDNFNGVKIKGRTIRVDHVASYRVPKEHEDEDEITKKIRQEGVAPRTPPPSESEEEYQIPTKKAKKEKKKKEKTKKKKEKDKERAPLRSTPQSTSPRVRVKKEKDDPGYRAAELGRSAARPADIRGNRGDRSDKKQEGDLNYKELDLRRNRSPGYREERWERGSRDARDTRDEEGRDTRNAASSRRDGGRDVREAQDRQDYKGSRYYDHQDSRQDRDRRDVQSSRDKRDDSYRERDDRNQRGGSHSWERQARKQGRRERDDREHHTGRSGTDRDSKATAYSDPWDRGQRDKERGRERDRKDRMGHGERKKSQDREYQDRR